MLTTHLTVTNVDLILREINAFDKEAQSTLRKEIKAGVDAIAQDARGKIPGVALSNWGPWNSEGRDLSFSGPTVAARIRPRASLKKIGGLYGATGSVVSKSPAGAIWALAGAGSSDTAFTRNLNAKYSTSSWPRGLTEAWRANIDKVRQAIADAIVKAAAAVGR